MKSTAHIKTDHASKYLVQVSKHWTHRFPTLTYPPERADVPLPAGPAVLLAREGELEAIVTAEDEDTLARVEKVVEEHVRRFGFRESLEFQWSREA